MDTRGRCACGYKTEEMGLWIQELGDALLDTRVRRWLVDTRVRRWTGGYKSEEMGLGIQE